MSAPRPFAAGLAPSMMRPAKDSNSVTAPPSLTCWRTWAGRATDRKAAHTCGAHLGKADLLRTGDLGHRTDDAADVINREAAMGWGRAARPSRNNNSARWRNTMRNFLAFVLLITLSASADAATLRHHHSRHHVTVRPDLYSGFAAVPGWAYARPAPPAQYDYSPDLSTLGGQPPCGC